MNSLSLFKLIIPTLKTTNKILHPQSQTSPDLLKQIYSSISQSSNNLKIDSQNVPIKYQDLIKQNCKITTYNDEEDQIEQLQLTKTNLSFNNVDSELEINNIKDRVKSTQYQANNPCEDSLAYSQLTSINAYAVSVFDGHGGPELAEYSKAKINTFIDQYLSKHLKKTAEIGEIIKESLKWSYKKIEDTFFQTYEMQLKLGNKKIKNVGTCGITAIIHNDKVYVGNAGDSQAIFILAEETGLVRSERANSRLNANNKTERERIQKEWEGVDDQIITQESSNAYYLKGRLQPTRTIGDYYLKKEEYYFGSDQFRGPYLTCTPEVGEHQITKAHKFMVIASDGIWDMLTKAEVVNSLMYEQEIDLNKTCYDTEEDEIPHVKKVVNSILQKVSELSGKSMSEIKSMEKGPRRNYHDDITLAVIKLENQL